ncbi:MAG TPA: hypothetical protein VD931_05580 [Baekduia sp.]|nr:hypothetical protein [Baekduia sp.]
MSAREITSTSALRALQRTADALDLAPEALSPADYRRYRTAHSEAADLPSHLAISLMFGGWNRACDLAGRDLRRSAHLV